jgi:hypothetical protein
VLVSHPAIEPTLRRLVARGRKVDSAEPLIRFILRERRLRAGECGGDGGGGDCGR